MLPRLVFSSLPWRVFQIMSVLFSTVVSAKIAQLGPHDNTNPTTITIKDRAESGIFAANLQINVSSTNGGDELICYQDLGDLTEQERGCLSTKVFSDGGQLITDQGYSIALVVLYELDTTISTCRSNTPLRKKILPVNALNCQESSLQQQQMLGINNLVKYGAFATYRLQNEIERRMEAAELTDDQLARRPRDDGPF